MNYKIKIGARVEAYLGLIGHYSVQGTVISIPSSPQAQKTQLKYGQILNIHCDEPFGIGNFLHTSGWSLVKNTTLL